MIKLERVFKTGRISHAVVGVTRKEFDLLLNLFFQSFAYYEKSHKIDFARGRKSIISQLEDILFFILFYFKTYPTYDVLGIIFDMDRTTACKQVHILAGLLLNALDKLDLLPRPKKENN